MKLHLDYPLQSYNVEHYFQLHLFYLSRTLFVLAHEQSSKIFYRFVFSTFLLQHFGITNDRAIILIKLYLHIVFISSLQFRFPIQYSCIYSRSSIRFVQANQFSLNLFEIQRPVIIHNSNVTGTVSIRPRTFAELKRGTNCKQRCKQ